MLDFLSYAFFAGAGAVLLLHLAVFVQDQEMDAQKGYAAQMLLVLAFAAAGLCCRLMKAADF